MSNSGVKILLKLDQEKLLTGMVKRTIKNVKCFSINSIADIESLKDEY
jgi:hypothetical protein